MNRSLLLIFLILTALAGEKLCAQTYTFGCDEGYPPYEFTNQGLPDGLLIDILKEVGKSTNTNIKYVTKPWSVLLKEFDANKVDIVALYNTKERAQLYDFTIPFEIITHCVFVKKDNPIKNLVDINHKKIVVEETAVIYEYVNKIAPEAQYITANDPVDAIKKFINSDAQILICPRNIATKYIEEHDIEGIEYTNIEVIKHEYCFAVKKGNLELLARINEGLSLIKSDGRYDKIFNKWLGITERDTISFFDALYWAALIIVPLVVVIGLFLLWNYLLRKKVLNKTAALNKELEDRVQAERQTALFRFALDHTVEAVLGVNSESNIFYVNDSAIKLLKLERVEIFNYQFESISKDYKLVESDVDEKFEIANSRFILTDFYDSHGNKIPIEGSVSKVNHSGSISYFVIFHDIVERTKLETILKSSEEQFRSIYENNNSIMLISDMDKHTIISANNAACKFYGYSKEQFVNMDMAKMNPKEAYKIEEFINLLKKEKSSSIVIEHFLANGTPKVVEVSGSIIPYSDKNVLFSIITDMTEKHEALRMVRKSEEKFSKAFKTSPDAFALSRIDDGYYIDINDSFVRLMEYDIDEVISNSAISMNIWEDISVREHIVSQIKTKGIITGIETNFFKKSGKKFPVMVSASLIEIDSVPHMITIFRDISDTKALMEQISKERQRLEITLRSIGDGVIATDNNQQITLMNGVAQDLTGWTEESAVGRSIYDIFNIINEDTRTPQVNPVVEALKYGKTVNLANHTLLISKTGSERVIADSAAPIKSLDGEVIGAVLVFRDTTEITRMQNELKKERDYIKQIYNTTETLICILDKNKKIIGVNEKALKVSGYSEEELINHTLFEFLVKQDEINTLENVLDDMYSGKAFHKKHTNIWLTKSGEERIIDWNNSAIYSPDNTIDVFIGSGVDVTDVIKTENKLAELAKLYEVIIETSGQILYSMDLANGELEWFGAIKATLGYELGEMSRNYEDWKHLIYFEDYEEYLIKMQIAQDSKALFSHEYRVMNKQNKYVWLLEKSVFIEHFESGKQQLIGMIQYIDPKKREEQINEALFQIAKATNSAIGIEDLCEKIHRIIDSLVPAKNMYIALYDKEKQLFTYPYFVDEFDEAPKQNPRRKGLTELVIDTGKPWLVDPEEFYALVNSNIVELIGAPSVDWLGVPLKVNDNVIGALVVQSYKEGIRYKEEHMNLLSFVSNHIALAVDKLKTQKALLASYEDLENRVEERTVQLKQANEELYSQIEERLRVESEIRESEERFRAMADNAPVMIWMTDSSGNMQYINKTWADFTGLPIEKQLGKTWFALIHPEDIELVQTTFEFAIHDMAGFNLEYRIMHKEFGYRWLRTNAVPRFSDGKNFYGLIGSCEDINDLKSALEKEIELNSLKTRFISTVSHEYRTPLTTILTSTYLIDNFIKNNNTTEAHKFLNRIQNSVNNMTTLLDQVLTISRADAGKTQYNPKLMRPEIFLKNLVEEMGIVDKSKHEYDLICTNADIEVLMDTNMIHQIVSNLLTNASKYSPSDTKIVVNAVCRENSLILEVIDFGNGIPQDQLPHLFEPFFRATNAGVVQGTGLGLSIVKRCVEICHGTIEVESKIGKGSKFTVTLPFE